MSESKANKSLGVLYTGYLEKKKKTTSIISKQFKKRFVVLTNDALHWFHREEGYDLFGEERGQVSLANIVTIRILDEDSSEFEITGLNKEIRYFKAGSAKSCEEWVSAIKSAKLKKKDKNGKRRNTLSDIRNMEEIDNDSESSSESLLFVSLKSSRTQSEVILVRNPMFEKVIKVNNCFSGDSIIILTASGGTSIIAYEQLEQKCYTGDEFDAAITGLQLASFLRVRVDPPDSGGDVYRSRERENGSGEVVKPSFFVKIKSALSSMLSDKENASLTISSGIVILVSLLSFKPLLEHFTWPTALLFGASLLLAASTLRRAFKKVDTKVEIGRSFNLIILGHSFSSDLTPVHETEDIIPQRFIIGCDGDLKEARRRWDLTRHWREENGVDDICDSPQPYFDLVKKNYPFYNAGRGKEGHIVFYERPGELDQQALKSQGMQVDDLVRHWTFVTEYQWKYLATDEFAKSIAVIDIGSVAMAHFSGEPFEYTRKTIGLANAHYPERSYVIFVVNAPSWFSFFWKLIKPLIHPNTQKKIRILSRKETLEGLQEHIDISLIPDYYGGKLDYGGGPDSCRFNSPESLQMQRHADRLNGKVVSEDAGEGSGQIGDPEQRLSQGPSSVISSMTSNSGSSNYSHQTPNVARRGVEAGRGVAYSGDDYSINSSSISSVSTYNRAPPGHGQSKQTGRR